MESHVKQGTDDWLLQRAGHATASAFADVLSSNAKTGKPLKAKEDYLMKLVVERLTGEPTASANSFATNWGHDAEPFARAEYVMQAGNIVREVGFIKHPTHPWVGASSDGLVGTAGGIEIKCPYNSAIHLTTWRDGMPEHHLPQVMGQMWVLGLDWVDFCSFDPRMPPELRLYVERVERSGPYIADLESKVLTFLAEVEAQVQDFSRMGQAA